MNAYIIYDYIIRNILEAEIKEKDSIASGMKIVVESITNIRTIASLSK